MTREPEPPGFAARQIPRHTLQCFLRTIEAEDRQAIRADYVYCPLEAGDLAPVRATPQQTSRKAFEIPRRPECCRDKTVRAHSLKPRRRRPFRSASPEFCNRYTRRRRRWHH